MSQMFPSQNESIALVVDVSSSAIPWWDETRQTTQRIHLLLEGSKSLKLYTLGNSAPISSNILKQPIPPGFSQKAQVCSLITPIMEVLVRQEQKYSLIV